MADVISFIIGGLSGFLAYLLFEIYILRKEAKKNKKEIIELEKEYNLMINSLRRELKGKAGV